MTSSGPTKMDTAAPRMKRHAPLTPAEKIFAKMKTFGRLFAIVGIAAFLGGLMGGAALAHGAGAGHGQAGPDGPAPRDRGPCDADRALFQCGGQQHTGQQPCRRAYPHLGAHCGRHGEQLSGLRLALHPGHVSGARSHRASGGALLRGAVLGRVHRHSPACCSGTAGMSPGTGIRPFPAFPRRRARSGGLPPWEKPPSDR